MATIKAVARRLIPRRIWSVGRRRVLKARVARYDNRQVTHTYGGHQLTIELPDALAAGWYDRPWDPLPEILELKRCGWLKPGGTIFDIGAHQGLVALMLARETGNDGLVIAVEAEAHNARAAERNRDLNGAQHLKVIHAAGSDRPGTLRFEEGLNGHVAQTGGGVEVPAVTVDELARHYGDPDVVMVDVEGFELPVLRGARETLAKRNAAFILEVHHRDIRVGTVADLVAALDGYDLLQTSGDSQPYTFSPFELGERAERFFLLATPLN